MSPWVNTACGACDGTGHEPSTARNPIDAGRYACSACGGIGYLTDLICPTCHSNAQDMVHLQGLRPVGDGRYAVSKGFHVTNGATYICEDPWHGGAP